MGRHRVLPREAEGRLTHQEQLAPEQKNKGNTSVTFAERSLPSKLHHQLCVRGHRLRSINLHEVSHMEGNTGS